ncbi:MAG: MqnA/MqnD/SBP family protein [Planctomycetota bacterium]
MLDITQPLTLAHSPDADDLVMWWPLAGLPAELGGSGPAVDTQGLSYRLLGADVEELNKGLLSGDLAYDLCAISAAAYPRIADTYRITRCGGSFGEGYGPKLVALESPQPTTRPPAQDPLNHLKSGATLAIPGANTTAFAVLRSAVDHAELRATVLPFLEIAPAVAAGRFDYGLLIHEAQLTFTELGLRKALDLGEWWQSEHDLPLPLGLNVVRRDLDERFRPGTLDRVAAALEASIDAALADADAAQRYLLHTNPDRKEWRDRALLDRYLSMYVSGLTRDMGDAGTRGLVTLYETMHAGGLIDAVPTVDPLGGSPPAT